MCLNSLLLRQYHDLLHLTKVIILSLDMSGLCGNHLYYEMSLATPDSSTNSHSMEREAAYQNDHSLQAETKKCCLTAAAAVLFSLLSLLGPQRQLSSSPFLTPGTTATAARHTWQST